MSEDSILCLPRKLFRVSPISNSRFDAHKDILAYVRINGLICNSDLPVSNPYQQTSTELYKVVIHRSPFGLANMLIQISFPNSKHNSKCYVDTHAIVLLFSASLKACSNSSSLSSDSSSRIRSIRAALSIGGLPSENATFLGEVIEV